MAPSYMAQSQDEPNANAGLSNVPEEQREGRLNSVKSDAMSSMEVADPPAVVDQDIQPRSGGAQSPIVNDEPVQKFESSQRAQSEKADAVEGASVVQSDNAQ